MRFFRSICCCDDEEEFKKSLLEDYGHFSDDAMAEASHYSLLSNQVREKESSIRRRRQERLHRMTVIWGQQADVKKSDHEAQEDAYPKTHEQTLFLQSVLDTAILQNKNSILLGDMSAHERTLFVDCLSPMEGVAAGQWIYGEGEVGDHFYIVEEGVVELSDSSSLLRKGEWFGEVALLYDAPRTSSARARTACVLWKAHTPEFRRRIAQHALAHEESHVEALRKLRLFRDKNDDETVLRKFANALESVQFRKGDRIVHKGNEGQLFYIIERGQVHLHDIGLGDALYNECTLKDGDWLGEHSLLTGEPREYNATATSDRVQVWAVDKETFWECLSDENNHSNNLKTVLQHHWKRRLLSRIPILADSNIDNEELDSLAARMRSMSYQRGETLQEVGTPRVHQLWLIQKGEIAVYDGFHTREKQGEGKVFILQVGDYLGDKHIADDDDTSNDNVICEADHTTCWSLTKDDLVAVLKNLDRLGPHKPFQTTKKLTNHQNIFLKDLTKLHVLGHGAFGKVWLVRQNNANTQQCYALKAMHKREILDKRGGKAVLREKEILSTVRHPFILNILSSFQDDTYLYMLTGLVRGGELYYVIESRNGQGLNPDETLFYASCILEALAYFHRRLICYRDLKPENVMINEDGYCVLVDLGFAKVVTTKTFTLMGTPEYLAPECLCGKGHDRAVDYWSFGVMLYEMTTGCSPFYRRDDKTNMDMFRRIIRVEYDIPTSMKAITADLIRRLLVRNPDERIGKRSNGSRIRMHSFFAKINFEKLLAKEITPPWIPVIKEGREVYEAELDDGSRYSGKISFGRPLSRSEQSMFKGW